MLLLPFPSPSGNEAVWTVLALGIKKTSHYDLLSNMVSDELLKIMFQCLYSPPKHPGL